MPSNHSREAAAPLRPLDVKGADAGRNRRLAAEALFEAMDEGRFHLDLAAVDRLNAARQPDLRRG